MAIVINTERLKDANKLPLFTRGNLVYEKSGHVLTHTGNYYICSQKCKKMCSNKTEKNLKIITFERKFARQMHPLLISDNIGRELFYKLDKEAIEIRQKVEEELNPIQELLDLTLTCIKQDKRGSGKVNTKDVHDIVEQYFKTLKLSFPNFIVYLIQSNIKSLTMSDVAIAKAVSAMIDKLYIQDNGKISKLELNGLGDYFFQYLETNIIDYFKNFKISIVKKIKFPSLRLVDAISYFKENSYRNFTGYSVFASEYEEKKQKSGLHSFLSKLTLDDLTDWVYFIRDRLWKMPLAQFSNCYNYDKNRDIVKDFGLL